MMSGLEVIVSAATASLTSFVVCLLIVLTQGWHGKLSLDSDTSGVQKFHKVPVPRVGGIALMAAMLAVALFVPLESGSVQGVRGNTLLMLLAAGLPAFGAGLMEDVTKKVSVNKRLMSTIASALLASWLCGAILSRVDLWAVDSVFQWLPAVAVLFTAFAVAGVANSINIVDGFHGIAGSTVIIILGGLGFLAWEAGDLLVVQLALVGAAAMFGFLLVNYPTGRLFLGDGGAYLAGFWVAEVAILLIARNPGISAWQALAVCAYPIIEALYSIYRKRVVRKKSPTMPDKLHLHMLVYRRLVWRILPRNDRQPWIRNSMVAVVLAVWTGISTLVAVMYGTSMVSATLIFIMEVVVYVAIYQRLIQGRLPARRPEPADVRAGVQTDSPARESV